MKIKTWLALILLFLCSVQIVSAQEKVVGGGIVNGRAIYLPKPNYSQDAKDFCASGQVQVEVLIGEDGNVVSAKLISGDELLRDSAVDAAKKAKFSQAFEIPVKVKGIVVYNFVLERKCIVKKGAVNKKALSIPKPQVGNIIRSKHLRILEEQTVEVEIIIEIWSGKVIRARAVSGNPLLRSACEASARRAKFPPTNDVPVNIPIKATLVYKFKPHGVIEF